MNQDYQSPGVKRAMIGCLLGVLLALISPVIILTELMSLLMVVLLPSIGLMLLYRWAGKGPAFLSAVLQLSFTAQLFGFSFMWVAFLTSVLPAAVLIRAEKQPFFTRMKISIAAYCGGMVSAVAVLYFTYGGNMIDRMMSALPEAMRTIPAEALEMPMQTLAQALGREITPESFYALFEDMIAGLVPYYQLNLPGLLLGGALVTAVVCAGVDGRMCRSMNPGAYVPLREWYLASSTTGGILTMALAGYAIYALGMQQGKALYYTVYNITLMVFCIQALASMARHLHDGRLRKGAQKGLLIAMCVLCLMGASLYVGIYGCASAVLGRKGSLRQRLENNNHKSNHHSDEQ